nr:MAG: hypothetical protein [Crogonang virus 37]
MTNTSAKDVKVGEPAKNPKPVKAKAKRQSKEVQKVKKPSKVVKAEKPKTDQPPQKASRKRSKPVQWVDQYYRGGSEYFVAPEGTAVPKAQNSFMSKLKCMECNGRVVVNSGWEKVPTKYKGNNGMSVRKTGYATAVVCLSNKCMSDFKVELQFQATKVSASKKAGPVSPPIPKGKPVITEQPNLKGAAPADISESQSKSVFETLTSKSEIREKIREAFAKANADFRNASQPEKQKLIKVAKQMINDLRKLLPRRLNMRWNKPSQLRTYPMRWTVPRVQVHNPLWSTVFGLVAMEADSRILPEDIVTIQDAAYSTALIENSLMKVRSKKVQTPKEIRTTTQTDTSGITKENPILLEEGESQAPPLPQRKPRPNGWDKVPLPSGQPMTVEALITNPILNPILETVMSEDLSRDEI